MLDIALLGTSGMMPLPDRFLTSLMCRLNGRFLLIDCGEGTQITMKMLGWGFKNLDCICFTHFHADHISGLPGLLLTLGNSGRTEDVTIIGPVGIGNVVKSLCIIAQDLPFSIKFIELDNDTENICVGEFILDAKLLNHRITCFGYCIRLERVGKFDIEKAKLLDIPKELWSKLQKNISVEFDGETYTSDCVMGVQRKGIKVCYITDTRPMKALEDFVRNADLFVAEGIYGDDQKLDKAIEYKHMLFSEAATIAKNANVDELWLTHFSPSLTEPEEYLPVAQNIFENTKVGYDRIKKTILFRNE